MVVGNGSEVEERVEVKVEFFDKNRRQVVKEGRSRQGRVLGFLMRDVVKVLKSLFLNEAVRADIRL